MNNHIVYDNHYQYLESVLPRFFDLVGVDFDSNAGIISAHGDKCYGQRMEWEERGIPFNHGVAVYLLTHVRPYGKEVRGGSGEWVSPVDWVANNYNRFKPFLDQVDEEYGIGQAIRDS